MHSEELFFCYKIYHNSKNTKASKENFPDRYSLLPYKDLLQIPSKSNRKHSHKKRKDVWEKWNELRAYVENQQSW